MNEIVKIRYDIVRFKYIDGAVSSESKTVFIHDELHQVAILEEIQQLKHWFNTVIQDLQAARVKNLNLEVTFSLKTKAIPNRHSWVQAKEIQLSSYDVSENTFTLINQISYEDSIFQLLERNKKQVNTSEQTVVHAFKISKETLEELLRQFVRSLSFEHLAGTGSPYGLKDLNCNILGKQISIILQPTDEYDDQGYLSESVTIVDQGILTHILSFNENSELHRNCVGGYTMLDENRKPEFTMKQVDFLTKKTDSVSESNLEYTVQKAYLKNGVVWLQLMDTEQSGIQMTDAINHFLNSLVYLEDQEMYVYKT